MSYVQIFLRVASRRLSLASAAEEILRATDLFEVADEKRDIQRAVMEQLRQGAQLVLTTGGTGVAVRDITPEAVREIASRELPGFGEVMRMESMKITPNAILSRSLAAVVEKGLVLCLPGKPKGAVECLGFVVGAIPHCVKVIQEVPTSC